MFVQIIEGQVTDAAALRQQMDAWMADLRPGATGYLGTTAGQGADGRFVGVVRFDSEESALANSNRPEQGEWWAETQRCFDGAVTFTDSNDVELFMDGGSNDAGFVQVMKVTDVDRETVRRLDSAFEQFAPTMRPDLLGFVRAWTGPGDCVEAAYFTSEADARAGESVDPPAELQPLMADYQEVMAHTEFVDLRDPWLF